MSRIKIILVDDHKMFRDGVKAVLSDDKGLEFLAEVGSADELFVHLKKEVPDIVITDISMPDKSGIDMAEELLKSYPDIRILFLSMHSNVEFITRAISVGASGYIPKDAGMEELFKAVYAIYNGQKYFNREISGALLDSYINELDPSSGSGLIHKLTLREKEVIRLIVDGLSNSEIADKLFISIRTVDSHKSNILQKLRLKSKVELVKFAIKHNLASLS